MQEEDQKVLVLAKTILLLRDLIIRKTTPLEVQVIIIVPEEVLMKVPAGHQLIMDHLDIQVTAVEGPTHPLQAIIQDQEVQVEVVEVVAQEVVNFK